MNDYDATIKLLIQDSANEMLRQLGIGPVKQWLNVELPKVQKRRVDLLGMTASGLIVHIELQSKNHPQMPLRMAEYALLILRIYKQYPHQLVLFVGNGKLTMKPVLETPGMSFHYDQLDIRHLDGGRLIESARISDNVLALLAKLDDSTEGIRTILRRIAKLKREQRSDALSLLFSTAQLRSLQHTVSEELKKMPIVVRTSINDKTFGPWIRKGLEKGRLQGLQEAFERAIRIQLQKRFGALPSEIDRRVATLSPEQAEQILLAIVDAKSLEELFPGAANQSSGERNLKGRARRGNQKTRQD